jgi:hypothetical protein
MSTTSELVERLKSLADVIPLRTPNAYTAGDIDVLFYAAASLQKIDELERENARLREAICTAVDSARPYRDESGVIEISLHPFGALMRVRDDIARAALIQPSYLDPNEGCIRND